MLMKLLMLITGNMLQLGSLHVLVMQGLLDLLHLRIMHLHRYLREFLC